MGIVRTLATVVFGSAILRVAPLHALDARPPVTDQRDGAILPSDAEIHRILAERIHALAGEDDGIGIVVGVIGPQGRRIVSYGHGDHGDLRPLDGDTGFEIASVTKVFTALLLADMVQRGEVALMDPVARYLPADVKVPERNGRTITLLDLATHTSSLPFMPDNMATARDSAGSKYGPAQLYQFLVHYQLPRDIGAEWDYSNIGYWLLGQALAFRSGTDYESLLRERVLAPLRLKGTAATWSPRMKGRFAAGHDAALQPAPAFATLPVYSAMADVLNLDSTANDLLNVLAVAMGYERSSLTPAMTAMLGTRRPKPPAESQALGWVVTGAGDDQFIYHDGGSAGFASSVVWDPKRRVGVVVLSNQVADVSDIARHLLRPDVPLEKPTSTKRTEIVVAPEVLDRYVGRYEAQGEGAFVFAREGQLLTIQLPDDWGLPKMTLHPDSLRSFFARELPLQVKFLTDSGGHVEGALIYPPRGQEPKRASRVGADH
jgi:CubicO group peptidase (beta-lactamase class C family)